MEPNLDRERRQARCRCLRDKLRNRRRVTAETIHASAADTPGRGFYVWLVSPCGLDHDDFDFVSSFYPGW